MGPKQREFSVKDRDEFEFKPQVILLEIVQIYLNLEDSDRFCIGVLSDERSFSEKLLHQTAAVLQKVSQSPQTITDFMVFQEKLKVGCSSPFFCFLSDAHEKMCIFVVVVALSSLARILGECSTNCSLSAFFFFLCF